MSRDRRLTFIIVPHGDLETRTYELSYRRLKVMLGGMFLLLVAFVVIASSWWYVASQAARVPGLEQEVATLEAERAQVAELAQTLATVESQYQRVREILGADAAVAADEEGWLPPLRTEAAPPAIGGVDGTEPSLWPLTESGYVTRELTDGDAAHPGLDIAVAHDAYVRAAGAGTVRDAGTDEVYGRYVLIDHGDGLESMYGHTSRVFVEPGDAVERGELIALSGSTGRSTAPHLHFEIRRDGRAEDPLAFVRQP